MIPEQRKKILYVFMGIYLIFAILIIYLFLFNSGLEIVEEFNEEEGTKAVFVQNITERVIHNVTIKYLDNDIEFDLNTYRFLEPKGRREISLEEFNQGQITLIAEAPFHVTIEKLIVLRSRGETNIKMNFPSDILFGKTFMFSIEICNNSKEEEQFRIEEKHETGFFSEPDQRTTLNIPANECKTTSYSLLPTQQGETTIYFNVSSSNTNEHLQQPIKVD